VILAPEVTPRKAEGAVHEPALAAPLHAGAEFVVTEMAEEWCAIALADGRAGWVPRSAIALLD
jgi:SH3-like domain-containing protein